MSFATSVVLVEHIVRGCMRLAVGSQVEEIVEGRPCTASAAFEGTCTEHSVWACPVDRTLEGRSLLVVLACAERSSHCTVEDSASA
jgi:hypothetical protein